MSLSLPALCHAAHVPVPSHEHSLFRTVTISAVTADSRAVTPGTLFVALPGTKTDGRAFIASAVTQGAAAVLMPDDDTPWPSDVPQRPLLRAENPRKALALMAAALAGRQPAPLVAVTGTNGKTSTVGFLRQLWALHGFRAAALGTLGLTGTDLPPLKMPALTTPDPVALANGLATLAQAGVNHVALEASSHGLQQNRLDGLHLTAAGFTNLTRDHLDYHGTPEAYRTAKLRLFSELLPEGAVAAANADMDPQTLAALRETAKARKLTLRTVGAEGDYIRLISQTPLPTGQEIVIDADGSRHTLTLSLPGRYQVDNILLAAALAAQNDISLQDVIALLPGLEGVKGRMERVLMLPDGAAAYVDYAHTPDALASLLASLRPHTQGRLIVVFGAGGDRDRGKRPLMAREAAKGADIVIITDDNPRTEDAASIRAEVRSGAPDALTIGNRRDAIAKGLSLLAPQDILVIAGKGHEQGQIIGTEIHPFDDASVLRELAGVI
ncbi:UDP-N-acetylmuramoylalanyl-D-glutamate--2,6-diaminopimelate ligase [Acetobacter sp. DmW_043]|uniref:UDP-N-acetylmuramoyl-L-alanyl-D-glutamate--2, 6-diaminopimelate ligase n=1 Tax=Acetobacter sp. DmW_043 TaxID=1670658 RepID=UPI000A3CCC87|nr:UDP-N-acetylmuramoyl-L-alanyl-D-glutamate--2,6-diaminopimelate ligase [Acetobacter sp. DmW_043]OUI88400.1 UDP-N-acetylmuramoylalanyl-D-glutamate--2,6-diaminopimelate ligase [Acetobacter sp. DmW_043]